MKLTVLAAVALVSLTGPAFAPVAITTPIVPRNADSGGCSGCTFSVSTSQPSRRRQTTLAVAITAPDRHRRRSRWSMAPVVATVPSRHWISRSSQ